MEDVDKIVQSLSKLVQGIENILTTAREYVGESVEVFVAEKVGVLASAIGLYSKAYQSLNVMTKDDFEKLISQYYKRLIVQYAFEDLMEVEREWQQFLELVDQSMTTFDTETILHVGQDAPVDTPLVDVRTDTPVTLSHYCGVGPLLVDTISRLGGRVLVLSFGVLEGAQRWLADTQCHFDMAVDADRQIYHAIGLRCSVAKVWNMTTINYYAEKVAAKETLPTNYKDLPDDPHQLGGDLLVASSGQILFVYCSESPADRPDVHTILDIMLTADKTGKGQD